MKLDVLVVDDSSVMRAMIIRTLWLSGLPVGVVYEAGNGQEGLRLLREKEINLLLLDLNMPVMGGEELLDRVRSDPDSADLPVVVVSTEGSFTRIKRLRSQGAGFVHKPFTPENLRQAIVQTIGAGHEQQAPEGVVQGRGPDF